MNMIRVYVTLWLMNRYQQVLNLNYTKTAINKKQRRIVTYEYDSGIRCTLVDEPLLAGLEFELYKNSNKHKNSDEP